MAKHNSNYNVLLGILAGGVVGALTAAAVTSRRGRELREELYGAYHDAGKKLSHATHNFTDRAHGFTDKFLNRNNHNAKYRNLTIGAVASGILGLSALLYLSSDAGKGVRRKMQHTFQNITDHSLEDIAHFTIDRVGEKISPWIQKAEKFIDAIHENDSGYSRRSSNGTTLDKVLDWAVVAAQTIQSLKNKR